MPRPSFSPLPYQLRADLFAHLAAMENAGLAPDKAFGLLRVPASAQARVEAQRKFLKRGNDPASAGFKSGLFNTFETALLRAALAAGSPGPSYKRLAARYATKAAQLATLKARMMLPLAMLIMALAVRPLPGLVTGSLGAGAYLWQVASPLILLALLGMLALRVPAWFLAGDVTPGRELVERILLALPLCGKLHNRRNARDFVESLALLLEAGLPMFDAYRIALATINNSILRADVAQALPLMEAGAPFAQAITALSLVDTTQLHAFAVTGEESGTLPEMLLRHARTETELLDLVQSQIVEWLPRIFYAFVAMSMIRSLIF